MEEEEIVEVDDLFETTTLVELDIVKARTRARGYENEGDYVE